MSIPIPLKVCLTCRGRHSSVRIFICLGRWHCVKRTLPECGNYNLESHLPVFLWKQNCDRDGKDYFWELLRLLHKHQATFFDKKVEDDSVYFITIKGKILY